eukprot:4277359-Alexandrium_andersonii.AAC.1
MRCGAVGAPAPVVAAERPDRTRNATGVAKNPRAGRTGYRADYSTHEANECRCNGHAPRSACAGARR